MRDQETCEQSMSSAAMVRLEGLRWNLQVKRSSASQEVLEGPENIEEVKGDGGAWWRELKRTLPEAVEDVKASGVGSCFLADLLTFTNNWFFEGRDTTGIEISLG